MVNKAAEAMFHCSLDSTSAGRLLQIPQWMFDAAAMCGIRLESSPVVDAGSLQELKTLLSTMSTDGVVQGQQSSADNAGEKDAKTIKAVATGTPEALPSRGNNAGVEHTGGGSSATSTSASRSTVARSGRPRASLPRSRRAKR
jgi:glyceraldehyde-3-phosphate dehydrogenase/erythrose-4-phosphate dehydrogenase